MSSDLTVQENSRCDAGDAPDYMIPGRGPVV
jgi:hypothetical protein